MVGTARNTIRIEIDEPAYKKLGDFGRIVINGPTDVDFIEIVYRDEDLEAKLGKEDTFA